jgi:ABC-type Fe3+/spermidine/putrescine transport system ATPase subunit
MSDTHIEISHLTKTYGKKRAIDNINLSINKGELLAIVGPSGCGKTTLLRSIAGLETPDSGFICINGETVFEAGKILVSPNQRRVGMVFQNYALWPHMTIEQNIGFPLKMNKTSSREKSEKIKEVLSLVRLDWAEKRYPHQLSAGERQRAALARSLVLEPKVLLLDEPLSNLDPWLRGEMKQELSRIIEELELTVVHVTHNQSDAMSIADRIAVMNNGHLVQLDTVNTIYNNPKTSFVAEFFGRTNLVPVDLYKKWFNLNVNKDTSLLSIRPEDIQITTSSDGLKGHVAEKIYLGNLCYLRIECSEGFLWVQSIPRVAPSIGETVFLKIIFASPLGAK